MAVDARSLPAVFGTPWFRSYARSKIRMDPVYRAAGAELAASAHPLLDVGCGIGLFAFYLRSQGFPHAILGVDIDVRKIADAQRIAEREFEEIEFRVADVAGGLPDFSGSVSVLDILQYFSSDGRRKLLREVASRVTEGGLLVMRNAVRDSSWRFRINQAGDQFARLTFWNRPPLVDYPTLAEITGLLADEGLVGRALPLWGKMPFNNYLFVFRREPAQARPRRDDDGEIGSRRPTAPGG